MVLRFGINRQKKEREKKRRGINYRHGNFLPISAKHRVIHRGNVRHDRTLFLCNDGEKKKKKNASELQ